MEEFSLSTLFENHLAFPGDGRARLDVESFCDRVVSRHGEWEDKAGGLEAWLDHFFEHEHAFEDRVAEFEKVAVATGDAKELSVLEFDLGEAQFVVIDSDDGEDVVVVSSAGALVFQRSAELVQRLRAAEVPATKPAGGTGTPALAYHVRPSSSGLVTMDARQVVAALKGAEVRHQAAPRIASAPARLAAFNPVRRARSEESRPRSAAAQSLRQVARAERTGAAASPRAVVFERGRMREERGTSGAWWQRLATAATQGGARTEGRVGRASALSLGRETVALRAGGVTAVVHRPTQGLARASSAASRLAVAGERRVTRAVPSWVSEFIGGAKPRTSGFWIDPAATAVTGRPGWVDSAMRQARGARDRAREELRGHLDPPRLNISFAPPAFLPVAAPRPVSTAPSWPVDREVVAGASQALNFASPSVARVEFTRSGHVASVSTPPPATTRAPLVSAGSVPATALRALYDGIERTAVREGLRISALRMDLQRDDVVFTPVKVEVETVSARAPERAPLRTSVDVATSTVRTESPHGMASTPSLAAIFAAPFEDAGAIRVGPELSGAVARSLAASTGSVGAMPALVETVVQISGAPARIRIDVPDFGRQASVVSARGAAPSVGAPSVASAAVGAFDLSGYGTLDWTSSQPPGVWVHPRTESAPRAHDWVVAEGAFFAPASSRPSIGSRAAVASLAFPLADVNVLRAPEVAHAPGAEHAGDDDGADVFSVPLPLHVQMAEAAGQVRRKARGERVATFDPYVASIEAPAQEFVVRQDSATAFEHPVPAGRGSPSIAAGAATPRASVGVAARSSAPAARDSAVRHAAVTPGSPAVGGAVAAGDGAVGPGPRRAKAITVMRAPRGADAPDQVVVQRVGSDGPSGEQLARAAGGGPILRKARGERVASGPANPVAASAPSIGTASRNSADFSQVQRPASPSANRVHSAEAYTHGAELHFAAPSAGPSRSLAAHEAMHASQQGSSSPSVPLAARPSSGTVSAAPSSVRSSVPSPVAGASSFGSSTDGASSWADAPHGSLVAPTGRALTRRRGPAPLTFRYPTQTRWWTGGTPRGAGKAGALPAGAAGTFVTAAAGARPGADVSSPGTGRPGAAGTSSAHQVAGRRSTAPGSPTADASPYVAAPAAEYVEAGSAPSASPADGETAYVMVSGSGEARVVSAKGASAHKEARQRGAGVDMTVVAAVAPQAPSLEQMATMPGHERPHAKGKKEGGGKAASTPKTDSLSLQGTVDSLAQRIYHRLKRRLAADRERFGG